MVLITVNEGEVKFEEMEIEVAKPVELLFKEKGHDRVSLKSLMQH